MYYSARYYDRAIGHFIGCPLGADTLVPDPTSVWDYNRFAYARLNLLKYNDPTGNDPACAAAAPLPPLALGCEVAMLAVKYGPTAVQLASQWADKVPAVWDRMFNNSSSNTNEQAAHSAGQNAGNSGTGDPNGWDPNKLNLIFRDAGERYQYQTSGTLYGQETRLNVNVNGVPRTLDVDNIVNGYLRESKFVNEANSFYSKQIGGSTGMHLHVGGWRDELQRYILAAEQQGYKGVKLFSNSQEAIRVAQELFGKEEWFQKIELIHQVAK